MDLTGIVLAGGKSRRMGRNKALLKAGDGTDFLQRACALLHGLTSRVFVGGPAGTSRCPSVPDLIAGAGPLGGIYSVMKSVSGENFLIIPVDMPLLTKAVMEILTKHHRPDYAVTVFVEKDFIYPFPGIYNRSILPVIEKQLQTGNYRMQDLIRSVSRQGILPEFDRRLLRNINTPSQYKKYLAGEND